MKNNAASGPGRRFNLGGSMLAKPPGRRRATEYLHASRAAAIWLILGDEGFCTIHTASKTTSNGALVESPVLSRLDGGSMRELSTRRALNTSRWTTAESGWDRSR
jgi:hypothetical protein